MNIKLICTCGAVEGIAENLNAKNGNRLVCCCDDCQAFANYLDQADKTLDQFGGTEVYQTSQAQIKIHKGAEHLRCVRLAPKGLIRWYADCCKTPIGNTVNAGLPFIAIIHSFIDKDVDKDQVLGKIRAYLQTRYAHGTINYPHSSKKVPVLVIFGMIRKILFWKMKGMNKPSAFFNDKGRPISKPLILEGTK